MSKPLVKNALVLAIALGLAACNETSTTAVSGPVNQTLVAADAQQFVSEAQAELAKLQYPAAQAAWVYQTNINQDTAALTAYLSEKHSSLSTKLAKQAADFNAVEVDADTRRKLNLMRNGLVLPAPADAKKSERLAQITSDLEGMYGSGKYCRSEEECLRLTEMSNIMATSHDPQLLLEMWQGWREVSVPMKALYEEEVQIANEGARELGFSDISELWRGGYDMPAADFAAELDRLWDQIKPFYDALHCHVRAKLGDQYGTDIVPQDKPIPAHLLGNMWAQSWGNIYDLV